eukprot:TRINITY_DN604_c0_g1_i1.p1 TRINITY_DN604_c0_g1~~TRINITY_DN604_c0_g1_i1.p1  ORF type:complete len:643 (+),score=217.70 TRINITY_DN604_c0_g1_i1:34-1929(+)
MQNRYRTSSILSTQSAKRAPEYKSIVQPSETAKRILATIFENDKHSLSSPYPNKPKLKYSEIRTSRVGSKPMFLKVSKKGQLNLRNIVTPQKKQELLSEEKIDMTKFKPKQPKIRGDGNEEQERTKESPFSSNKTIPSRLGLPKNMLLSRLKKSVVDIDKEESIKKVPVINAEEDKDILLSVAQSNDISLKSKEKDVLITSAVVEETKSLPKFKLPSKVSLNKDTVEEKTLLKPILKPVIAKDVEKLEKEELVIEKSDSKLFEEKEEKSMEKHAEPSVVDNVLKTTPIKNNDKPMTRDELLPDTPNGPLTTPKPIKVAKSLKFKLNKDKTETTVEEKQVSQFKLKPSGIQLGNKNKDVEVKKSENNLPEPKTEQKTEHTVLNAVEKEKAVVEIKKPIFKLNKKDSILKKSEEPENNQNQKDTVSAPKVPELAKTKDESESKETKVESSEEVETKSVESATIKPKKPINPFLNTATNTKKSVIGNPFQSGNEKTKPANPFGSSQQEKSKTTFGSPTSFGLASNKSSSSSSNANPFAKANPFSKNKAEISQEKVIVKPSSETRINPFKNTSLNKEKGESSFTAKKSPSPFSSSSNPFQSRGSSVFKPNKGESPFGKKEKSGVKTSGNPFAKNK